MCDGSVGAVPFLITLQYNIIQISTVALHVARSNLLSRAHQAFPCVNSRDRIGSLHILSFANEGQRLDWDLRIRKVSILHCLNIQQALAKVGPRGDGVL